jgi:hypothetical protein
LVDGEDVAMKATNRSGLTIKKMPFTERQKVGDEIKAYTYDGWAMRGWLNGQRVRKQFKTHSEALTAKSRLEVDAANADGAIRAVNTRLSPGQLAEAEAAFSRLGERSLSEAIEWFLANYKAPHKEMALGSPDVEGSAAALFLAERAKHVRKFVLSDYKCTMKDFCAAFPTRKVHEIPTEDVQQFLDKRKVGNKRFNNMRGELCTFFGYSMTAPRKWVRENPVTPIPAFRILRGLPKIITPAKAAEIMTYVETYDGGPRRKLPPGCLAGYYALCLFGGIRPDVLKGEIGKLAARKDLSGLVKTQTGVIVIPPEVSKVKFVRQIKIRANLAAWLARYPLERFPLLPDGARTMVAEIREKFALSHDVMRHTFISAHVARFKSIGEAALEAGNSEAMTKRHYLGMMTDAEGEAFWNIAPKL